MTFEVYAFVLHGGDGSVLFGRGFPSEPEARAFVLGVVAVLNVPIEGYDLFREGNDLVCKVDAEWVAEYDD